MNTRDLNHASIIVGRKATGKSTKLADMARKVAKHSKVLVMDVNGSPVYNGFTTIEAKDIKRWKGGGICKIMGTPSEESLEIIAADFRDGLVIFEDSTKYISGYPKPSIKTFLTDHRMYRCDLVFTFHSLKMVPPFFWQMISYVVLLKTQENLDPAFYKNRIPNFEAIQDAYNKVKANKDNYYSITVDTMI